jgi:hypothetical protein
MRARQSFELRQLLAPPCIGDVGIISLSQVQRLVDRAERSAYAGLPGWAVTCAADIQIGSEAM